MLRTPKMLSLPKPEPALPHTALPCFVIVAGHHGVDLTVDRLRHSYAIGDGPISPALMLRMAKEAGLRARHARLTWDSLLQLGEAYPALVRLANGNWVVVLGAVEDAAGARSVRILDPLAEGSEALVVSEKSFRANWQGDVMLVKRDRRPAGSPEPFGIRWFIPQLLRERRIFADVALAALLLYAFGIVVPIFFQLVIDKVLVHESFTTLYVLVIGATIALIFEAVFTYLDQ